MTSQPARSHTLPVEHLDYKYIQQCNDVKYLVKILRVLRLGIEGLYPHLTEFCEKRIESLDPKNRALVKESYPATPSSFSTEEWSLITEDLQTWQSKISSNDKQLSYAPKLYTDTLPPIFNRPLQKLLKSAITVNKPNKPPAVSRTYSDWDRFDVDAECAKIDECVMQDAAAAVNITPNIKNSDLLQEERVVLSIREREKGNEAYRVGDWNEALLYYTRSVSILPTAEAYNNRAQVEIKLQRWNDALIDCNYVLKLQPSNYKALLRRATVHINLENLHKANDDITTVLQSEPQNLTAKKLLLEVNKKLNIEVQQSNQVIRSKKLLIQEIEDDKERDENEQQQEKHCAQLHNLETPLTTDTLPTTCIMPSSDSTPTMNKTLPTNNYTQTRRSVKIIEVENDEDEDDDESYHP